MTSSGRSVAMGGKRTFSMKGAINGNQWRSVALRRTVSMKTGLPPERAKTKSSRPLGMPSRVPEYEYLARSTCSNQEAIKRQSRGNQEAVKGSTSTWREAPAARTLAARPSSTAPA